LLARLEHAVLFGISRHQRVFGLNGCDWLDRVRAPDGFRARLRQAEVQNLSGLDQTLDRSSYVFDRDLGVDAVLVVEIDAVGLESLEGSLDAKTDLRHGFDPFSSANVAANKPIADLLKRFAEKENATPAQVAIAWLLAQKPWIVPIPGTRRLDRREENLGAINVRLTPADLREMDTAFSKIKVHGGRMNEEQMKVVDQT
jgi:hypothetical protein